MKLLRHVIEDVLAKHKYTAIAVTELVSVLEDELAERVADRIADLRAQLERGDDSK
jgi:hypothetical protein